MRNGFLLLTVLLVIIGFLAPLAWVGAIITGLLAIGSAPPGLRLDGQPRTGGLFGGLIDDMAIARKMVDCPYCKKKIMKTAVKCPYCQEALHFSKPMELICPECGLHHPLTYRSCVRCGAPFRN